MQRPSTAQLQSARRLVAHEGGDSGSADACAAAAGRVYDKLHAQLAPLVGDAGVQSLLARSAKLARAELAFLGDVNILESSTKLRESLMELDPAVGMATAVTLFGTLLALMDTFIGDRLMRHLLRRAWPSIEETARGETKS